MKQGEVRIIAGSWRGRKLKVKDVKDLRPTPDRVRETLFNWLAPILPGAYCLDLFAGSGVLGFEALSRGAAFAILVDQSKEVIALLREEAERFKVDNIEIYQAKVPEELRLSHGPFDVVFLDPPYQSDLLIKTSEFLETQGYLAKEAYIYLEADHAIKDNELPENWRLVKSQKAGQVFYHLAKRESNE